MKYATFRLRNERIAKRIAAASRQRHDALNSPQSAIERAAKRSLYPSRNAIQYNAQLDRPIPVYERNDAQSTQNKRAKEGKFKP